MRRLVLMMMLAGCRQIFGIGSVDPIVGDGNTDDTTDVGIDVPPGSFCWPVPQVGTTICLSELPVTPVNLIGTLDTTAGAECALIQTSESVAVCVIAGTDITVDAFAVHGSRPLVLLATNNVTIKDSLDVASHIVGSDGPGANSPACVPGNLPSGNGAGQGGTFGTRGGNGGKTGGSQSGTSSGVGATNTLRGGCPGIKGICTNSGSGGGALLVIAQTISLVGAGTINASGASGTGAAVGQRGGNGGGSGGLIALAAAGSITIATTTSAYANGGAGGGGSGGTSPGLSASDPTGPMSGGVGGVAGGSGGAGGTGYPAVQDGFDGQGPNGGGGGGGGGGVIKLISPSVTNSGTVSPPPS